MLLLGVFLSSWYITLDYTVPKSLVTLDPYFSWKIIMFSLWKEWVIFDPKLKALVYDILPSTTAVFNYVIGSRKLSANEQFFVSSQTLVSLLQTTQIVSDICFITDHVAQASSNTTKIVWIETELFSSSFLPGVDAFMFTCVLGRQVASTVLSVPEPFGGRWPRL